MTHKTDYKKSAFIKSLDVFVIIHIFVSTNLQNYLFMKEPFLVRLNNKQREAFHELFQKYYRPLIMFAMRYLGGQDKAEDVVQSLFITVWERKKAFFSEESLHVFLYNSVRNICLNLLKHERVEKKYADYILTNEKDFEKEYDWLEEELYESLFKAIDELPPRCREVFLLSLDGKKNEEIAQELHITLLTVKTQKKKAIRYLRERLGDWVLLLIFS